MTKKFRLLIVILLSCVISAAFLVPVKVNNTEFNIENTASAQTEHYDSESADQTSLDPDMMFRRARLAYNGQMVVAASMREETLVHDRHVIGVGDYMEKIENSKRYLRMEMNYSCDNVRKSVQYISDASKDVFWISKNVGARKELSRVNAFKLNVQTANPELVASIDGVPITPVSLAGVPYILFQIEKNYVFSSCSLVRDNQTNMQYYVVVGTWKPERFPIPNSVSDNVIKWDAVPPEIPDTVKVYFGVNDLFPYRIYYYRNVKGNQTLISKLNFYDVSFDVRINIKQFSFSPSNSLSSIDNTNHYLKPEAIKKPNKKKSGKKSSSDSGSSTSTPNNL